MLQFMKWFCRQVVEYILDRNACLLPAYFAVTEIRKLYPEGQLSHWVCMGFNFCMQSCYMDLVTNIRVFYAVVSVKLLGSLISDFVDSFRPTARINSICGKRHMSMLFLWALNHTQLISASVCVSEGRCSLLPVVNNSGAICNSWKLDPSTLHFPLKGMLPFDKVT